MLYIPQKILFKIKFPNKKQTNESDSIDNNLFDKSIVNKNQDAYQAGVDIAKLITSYWNSQKNPRKAYIFNRRVHHGEIGSLLGLCNLLKKSHPIPTGILSGLGEGLAKDDYSDKEEWFTFKKKNNDGQNPRDNDKMNT